MKNQKRTLSEIGHPCNYNSTNRDCAWCSTYYQQDESGKKCIDQGNEIT